MAYSTARLNFRALLEEPPEGFQGFKSDGKAEGAWDDGVSPEVHLRNGACCLRKEELVTPAVWEDCLETAIVGLDVGPRGDPGLPGQGRLAEVHRRRL